MKKWTAWTHAEIALLREMRGRKLPYICCAPRLGRHTQRAVESKGQALGLSPRYPRTALARRRRRVARMHRAGYSPYYMAKKLGCALSSAYTDHRRLGLVPHRLPLVERGRRSQKALRRKTGQCMGEFASERARVASVAAGWPPVGRRFAEYLDALYRHGPSTCAQVKARLNRKSIRGVQTILKRAKDAGYLTAARTGPRLETLVYDLTPDLRATRRRAIAYQSNEVPE